MTFDARMERKLRNAVEEWRAILGRQVPLARQIVNKLLAEKITFTPEDRDGRRGIRFEATGTVEKLVEGIVPGRLPAVVSPTGEIWNTVFAQLHAFNSLRDMSLAA